MNQRHAMGKVWTWMKMLVCGVAVGMWIDAPIAQVPTLHFNHVTLADGLSSLSVNCIYQDDNGFTWIGTNDGLNLYDGAHIKVFRNRDEDPFSLPSSTIFDIAGSPCGQLWVSTNNGIACMNPWSGKCIRYRHDPERSGSLPADADNVLLVDRSERLWVGSGQGLAYLNPQDSIFKRVSLGGGNAEVHVASIFEDSKKRLWVGTFNGLVLLDSARRQAERVFYPSIDPRLNLVTCMLEDERGQLCVGSWGSGFCTVNAASDGFECQTWAAHPSNPYSENIVRGLAELPDNGGLVAATERGLLRLPAASDGEYRLGSGGQFQTHDPTDPFSVVGNFIHALHVSRDGILWLATNAGVSFAVPNHQLFHAQRPGMKGNIVQIFPNDPHHPGMFWTCTWYGEGLCLHAADGRIVACHAQFAKEEGGLDVGQVSAVVRRADSKLWVGTFGGLFAYDEAARHGDRIPERPGPGAPVAALRVNALAEDVGGNLWVATYGQGIGLVPANGDNFTVFNRKQAEHAGISDLVWCAMPGAERSMWLGMNDGFCIARAGVDSLKPQFEVFKVVDVRGEKVNVGLVRAIMPAGKGAQWVGSSNGLFLLAEDGKGLAHYGTSQGLAHSQVNAIAIDKSSYVWVATDNGLSRFDPTRRQFLTFDYFSGLPETNLQGSFAWLPNGKLAITSTEGWMEFQPLEAITQEDSLDVFLPQIHVSGNHVLFPENEVLGQPHEFSWKENDFSFSYVAPSYHGPQFVHYYCRLIGSDAQWKDMGQERSISYVGLPPGEYVFELKAVDQHGRSSATKAYRFQIHPPFWQRTWFLAAVGILIVVLVYLVIRYISTQQLRQQILRLEKAQAVERERSRISRDLHDDLGAGLTQIGIMSELVRRNLGSNPVAQEYLHSMAETSRELVGNMNEIIWTLNPANDTLASLAAYIRELAGKMLEPAGIALHVAYPDPMPAMVLSEERRHNIFLVLKEALHNTVKHADATQVWMTLEEQRGQLVFTIRDDGKGFDQGQVRESANGLKNMQRRATAEVGTLEVVSGVGEGTVVKLRIEN